MRGLTDRQERFVAEYVKSSNATQAAIAAGYSQKTAGQVGHKLLKQAEISARLEQRTAKVMNSLDISVERVLKERARLAFFDPRKLLDNTGRPKPLQDLDDDTAMAIAGVEVKDDYSKKDGEEGNVSTVTKYKLADKDKSLTALEHHLGMRKEDNKTANSVNIQINVY